jgi:hypothetical protein
MDFFEGLQAQLEDVLGFNLGCPGRWFGKAQGFGGVGKGEEISNSKLGAEYGRKSGCCSWVAVIDLRVHQ